MLHHTTAVGIAFDPERHQRGWLVLRVGAERHRLRLLDRGEFQALRRWSDSFPQRIGALQGQSIWLYKGGYYSFPLEVAVPAVARRLRQSAA